MTDSPLSSAPIESGPEGIGGWLILPTIGLFLTPLLFLSELGSYAELGDNFDLLDRQQKAFIIVEIIANLVIVVALPAYLLYLLFNKKRAFPRIYVGWAVANLIFIIVDLIAAKIFFGAVLEAASIELFDSETVQAIFRAVILVVLWVPYMLNSRRVANTFVH